MMNELAIESEVGEVSAFSSSCSFFSLCVVVLCYLCFRVGEFPFLEGDAPTVFPRPRVFEGLAAPIISFPKPGAKETAFTFKLTSGEDFYLSIQNYDSSCFDRQPEAQSKTSMSLSSFVISRIPPKIYIFSL